MLFYNEDDEICIKYEDSTYKVIGELDYLEVDGEWYRFSNNYFYEAQECDGDLDTNWDIRTHVRHMNIVEMEEAFAPPTYKNSLLDDVFRFEEGLKEDEYYVMFTVANNIRNARLKGREYTSAKVEKMEFENLGEGGVIKVLNLLHDEFTYDIELIENPREYEDRASLFLTWSNHFEF